MCYDKKFKLIFVKNSYEKEPETVTIEKILRKRLVGKTFNNLIMFMSSAKLFQGSKKHTCMTYGP